ncbi:MAG: type II secretion system F family protein [Parcubacteria group bacterium]
MAQAFVFGKGEQIPNPLKTAQAGASGAPAAAPVTRRPTVIKPRTSRRLVSALFVSRKEKEYLVENLSMLIGSGLSLVEVLDSIKGELRTRAMKKNIQRMREQVDAGTPLWRTIGETGLFPQHVVQLIRVGEESGRLPQNLKTIALQEEKDRKFRSTVRSAMLYPVFVLSLTILIGIGIAWFVLPRLASVFTSLDLRLPLITRILIKTGNFLGDYGQYVLPTFIVLIVIMFYLLFFNHYTRVYGQELLFKIPGVRRLIQEVEIARFGFLLGTLLKAGLPISDALDSVRRATISLSYKKLYKHLYEYISIGNTFKISFIKYPRVNKLIPNPIQQLIVAGERSAGLPDTLTKIGEIYESKTEITTKNLTVILEPVLLVIVWLAVLVVALAVIIPLYSLLGGLNQ